MTVFIYAEFWLAWAMAGLRHAQPFVQLAPEGGCMSSKYGRALHCDHEKGGHES
eukprot:CAMPEP_0119116950 /NCGR_PEP_ID=MMETSP1180-20130426/52570_1 /TAXON_ID=3052 ORGANISM="Chlamydomonas cf sp, Strain CCMP681" /NCGR_SAMPLE_ID=MMETSP1180 /ASSEMBLY_ACC=CAM_ASM_000741 /LENGTH=53 /DNA_ID=CAMNT_0007106153 /DNA_START=494 /DNA_END=655 /DNA_ORIENTATION=-